MLYRKFLPFGSQLRPWWRCMIWSPKRIKRQHWRCRILIWWKQRRKRNQPKIYLWPMILGTTESGKAEKGEFSIMLCLYTITFQSPDLSFLEVINQDLDFLACLGMRICCCVFFQRLHIWVHINSDLMEVRPSLIHLTRLENSSLRNGGEKSISPSFTNKELPT